MIDIAIKTPSQFVAEIEIIVKETSMSYFDACMIKGTSAAKLPI